MPAEHFGTVDELGARTDFDKNPQYRYGTFEYILPNEWGAESPVLPAFVFCIDISSTSILNGFFVQVVQTIK